MSTIEGTRAIDAPEKLAMLRGAVVTTVTAWRHGVTLGFNDSPLAINIEGGATLESPGRTESFGEDDRISLAKRLLDLLGAHAAAAAVFNDETFAIAFESDLKLIIRPDGSGAESYAIFLPDGSTLVG